jgi:hypothetical protein
MTCLSGAAVSQIRRAKQIIALNGPIRVDGFSSTLQIFYQIQIHSASPFRLLPFDPEAFTPSD